MDELLREFLIETNESLETVDMQLVKFEREPGNQDILRAIFRLVHTIKGTCGFLGLGRLEAVAHAAETVMGRLRDGKPVTRDAVSLILKSIDRIKHILAEIDRTASEPQGSDGELIDALNRAADDDLAPAPKAAAASTVAIDEFDALVLEPDEAVTVPAVASQAVAPEASAEEPAELVSIPGAEPGAATVSAAASTLRVSVDTLERLLTMVSELVLTRNQLMEIARQKEGHGFAVPLQRLSHVTAELQDCVMKTRMQPIGNAWHKLPRLMRDLQSELDKEIALVLQGADTELDRQVLDVIKDPLTHMVRNAADHGIESREARLKAGKPARATITLSAFHAGGTITIEVTDDGRGLDYQKIRAKALQKGLATEAEMERMSEAQILKFIFLAGFSTAEAITAISGRGVGLDVVHSNIETIGGTVDIRSKPGVGTTFSISLPLTLAIVPALLVGVGAHKFALPQTAVVELVRTSASSETRIERLDGGTVLALRGQLLPLMSLAGLLGLDAGGPEAAPDAEQANFVVVLSVASRRFAVLVESVFHTEEIVVKPLSSKLRHLPYYSGTTILGDGSVVLIVEPNGLARMLGTGSDLNGPSQHAGDAAAGTAAGQEHKTALLVFGAGERGPFAVPLSSVTRLEEVDSTRIEWSGDRTIIQYRGKLMPLVTIDGMPAHPDGRERRPCLVLAYGERSLGLVVDEIVDVVEERLDLDLDGARAGFIGSAVVRGKTTGVLDSCYILQQVFPDVGEPGPEKAKQLPWVLLADDSAFFRDMLVPVLRAAGYGVTTVGSGKAAIAALSEGRPFAAAILDRALPDMDGLDGLDAMRRERRGGEAMPVLVLSSRLGAKERASAMARGAQGVFSKFDRQGIVAGLEAAMGRTQEAA